MRTPFAKTIWFKAISILVVGVFFFQGNVSADLIYRKQAPLLPDYDCTADAIGLVTTVAMPFVPHMAAGMAATEAGQITAGVLMGAALGATPGLVTGDGGSAAFGAITGGIAGGLGTHFRVSNFNTATTKLDEMRYLSSCALETPPTAVALQAADYYSKLGNLAEAARWSNAASTLTSSATMASSLNGISNAINPAVQIQKITDKIAISFATQEASSVLTSAAVLNWDMSPRDAQLLGMVGSSVTGWSLGGLTTGGQEMMKDMYRDISPGFTKLVDSRPVLAGAITGAGLGSLQAVATMSLYDSLSDSIPDSTKLQLASLGGNALGTVAWSGIVGGLGAKSVSEQRYDEYLNQKYDEYMKSDNHYIGPASLEGFKEFHKDPKNYIGFQSEMRNITPAIVTPTTFIIGSRNISSGQFQTNLRTGQLVKPFKVNTRMEDYNWDDGMRQGIKSQVNGQFWKDITQRGLSIGIGWAAEREGVRPEHASNLGSTSSMLLANLPIWPAQAKPEEAKALSKRADDLELEARSLKIEYKIDHEETINEFFNPILVNQIEIALENKVEADIAQAQKWERQAKKLEGWHRASLREVTPITNSKGWDMVLEPVSSGLVTLAATNWRKDKVARTEEGTQDDRNKARADLFAHDWTAMNIASLSHAGVVALFNQKGWEEGLDEFGQIYLGKHYEFYGDMLSFGSQAFGARTAGRKDETVGASTIYGATQRNNQMWGFAGLNGFAAQAIEIRDLGGDWRLQMAQNLPSSSFAAATRTISSPSGGSAFHHTVRNMEGLVYTGIKNIAPYDLERISSDLAFKLENGNLKDRQTLREINRWIKESSYPAYLGKEGIRFPEWTIGYDSEAKKLDQTLENIVTKVKYPELIGALKEMDVNKPFELVFPAAPEIKIEEPPMVAPSTPVPIPTIEQPRPQIPVEVEKISEPIIPKKESSIMRGLQSSPESKQKVMPVYPRDRYSYPIEGGVYRADDNSTIPDGEVEYPSPIDNSYAIEGGRYNPDDLSTSPY